jgi:hypothetical protein
VTGEALQSGLPWYVCTMAVAGVAVASAAAAIASGWGAASDASGLYNLIGAASSTPPLPVDPDTLTALQPAWSAATMTTNEDEQRTRVRVNIEAKSAAVGPKRR